jgi:hypothetical protein
MRAFDGISGPALSRRREVLSPQASAFVCRKLETNCGQLMGRALACQPADGRRVIMLRRDNLSALEVG